LQKIPFFAMTDASVLPLGCDFLLTFLYFHVIYTLSIYKKYMFRFIKNIKLFVLGM
jgi:hypothetical protein